MKVYRTITEILFEIVISTMTMNDVTCLQVNILKIIFLAVETGKKSCTLKRATDKTKGRHWGH